jgi:uncharacterized protein GlcG (DUF336 family)
MRFIRAIASLALPVVFAAAPAAAQEVVTEKALSLDMAHAIAQGALEKCRADGYHVSVTVLDRDGLVKAAFRDDGSGPHTIVTSRRKAFTSVTFRQPSADWAKRVLTDPLWPVSRTPKGPLRWAAGCRSEPETRSSAQSA